jgi:ABC-type multidrug transport system fused ATPase/permease subunit
MGHQTGEALVPVLIGLAIDRGVVDGDFAGLLWWLGVLAVVYVGLSFSFRFGARAGERASVTAAHHLRAGLIARILAPEGGADDGRLPGELANIATEDARRVGAVSMALVVGIAAATGLAVGAVVLLRVSLPLGLLVLLGTPLLLWLVHLLSKPLERRSETEQERAARASGVAADLVAGLRVLKGIGAEQAAVARYRRVSRHSLTATLRAARAEAGSAGARVLEKAVARAVDGRTALIVAHRLSQAATADRIIVMDAGRIAETGRHDELRTAGGPTPPSGRHGRAPEAQGPARKASPRVHARPGSAGDRAGQRRRVDGRVYWVRRSAMSSLRFADWRALCRRVSARSSSDPAPAWARSVRTWSMPMAMSTSRASTSPSV